MNKKEVIMKYWRIEYNAVDKVSYLVGNAFGHPKCKDGEVKNSAKLIEVDPKLQWAETENTRYILSM